MQYINIFVRFHSLPHKVFVGVDKLLLIPKIIKIEDFKIKTKYQVLPIFVTDLQIFALFSPFNYLNKATVTSQIQIFDLKTDYFVEFFCRLVKSFNLYFNSPLTQVIIWSHQSYFIVFLKSIKHELWFHIIFLRSLWPGNSLSSLHEFCHLLGS